MAAGLTVRQVEKWLAANPNLIEEFAADNPDLAAMWEMSRHPLASWSPRPDQPDIYDEQTAFVNSNAKVAVCLGGNGSGKTDAAAYKVAQLVCGTKAPRLKCPFWIVGQKLEMVGRICWGEKLSKFIPKHMIRGISWFSEIRGWPYSIWLTTDWELVFKSYEQGRQAFQGESIGGWWLNEEGPLEIVEEVMARCRDYDSQGWADFTPIGKHSIEWRERHDEPSPGWEFYNLNVKCNHVNNIATWAEETFLPSIPEDMRATREYGAFASMSGAVFKEFRRHLHVVEPFPIPDDWHKIRAIDFGWNHPTACVWLARDADHNYYVYDCYMASGKLLEEHAREIQKRQWGRGMTWGHTYADTAGGQEIAEFGKLGIHCQGARKAVELGIECVRRMMMPQAKTKKPRFFILKTDNNKPLIRQIQKYHWDTPMGKGDRMREARDLPVKFDDDLVDALRYAIYTEESGGYGDPANLSDKPTPILQEWKRASKGFLVGA